VDFENDVTHAAFRPFLCLSFSSHLCWSAQVPDSLLLLSRPIGMLEQRPTDRAIRDALLNLDEQVLDEVGSNNRNVGRTLCN
jgi:hypothetical protein